MKNIRIFYLKIFIFLVVKFSVYLNRRVFVMHISATTPENVPSDCMSSEDSLFSLFLGDDTKSNHLAHSRSLIRILMGRILDSQACKISSSGQRLIIRLRGCAV